MLPVDPGEQHPRSTRRTAPPHPAELLDLFAAPAADSRAGASLLELAERAATAILEAQGSFTVGEVRVELGRLGLLANDGTEKLDALGALGRRMGCVACGIERQPDGLRVSHANRGTRWRRPTAQERAIFLDNAPATSNSNAVTHGNRD